MSLFWHCNLRKEGTCREDKSVQQGANFLRVEASRGGDTGRGSASADGDSEQTFYRRKQLYGGLGVGEPRCLRQLEGENRKLKQQVADLSLDKHNLQEVLSKKV